MFTELRPSDTKADDKPKLSIEETMEFVSSFNQKRMIQIISSSSFRKIVSSEFGLLNLIHCLNKNKEYVEIKKSIEIH